MKRTFTFLMCVVLTGCTVFFLKTTNDNTQVAEENISEYTEMVRGIHGAKDFWDAIRANQETGEIDVADVLEARQQVAKKRTEKAADLLEWEELGPNNVGGRTRGLIITKNDHNTLITGSVSGGIWKSTDAGSNWRRISVNSTDAIAVSTIAEGADGSIYVGTGEGFYFFGGTSGGGIIGDGIYKSLDGGETFLQLASTNPSPNSANEAWADVRRVACHPTDANKIYAAIGSGLQWSTDGGGTWSGVPGVSGSGGNDVRAGVDGRIHAIVGATYYQSDVNGENFVEKGTFSGARKAIAVSPADPNYIYVISVLSNSCLSNIRRSTDGGETWTVIGAGTVEFEPMTNGSGCQGVYDLAIGADPNNPDKIIIAGITTWSWSLNDGWRQIDNLNEDPSNQRYIHADKHDVVWHPTNSDIFYVISDGGIAKTENGTDVYPIFEPANKNYNVTQNYSVAAGHDGEVMCGNQDNGTQLIKYDFNSFQSAIEVSGGDGGYTEISNINGNIMFAAFVSDNEQGGQSGAHLRRSGNGGEGFAQFFDQNIDCYSASSTPASGNAIDNSSENCSGDGHMDGDGLFVTPFILWEDAELYHKVAGYQPNNIEDLPFNIIHNGQIFTVTTNSELVEDPESINVYENNAFHILYDEETSSIVADEKIRRARFFTGDLEGRVWVTVDALNLSITDWQMIGELPNANISSITVSEDGNTVWAGSTGGGLVRITGLNSSEQLGKSEFVVVDDLNVTTISAGNVLGGRFITGISIDPEDDNRVVVCAGNYGNSNYIVLSENATSLNPNFVSIQGDLPRMPLYDVVINHDQDTSDDNLIIVGSEMGVWMYDPADGSWADQTAGLGIGPVYAVRQERMARDQQELFSSCKVIYIGTHGRGIFRSTSLTSGQCKFFPGIVDLPAFNPDVTSIEEINEASMIVYPNPATDFTTVQLNLTQSQNVQVALFDLQGKMVKNITETQLNTGEHNLRLDVSEVAAGNYIVMMQTENGKVSEKITIVK